MGCVGNSGTGPPSCVGADGLDGADSVAVSPDGKDVYATSFGRGAVVLFERVTGSSAGGDGGGSGALGGGSTVTTTVGNQRLTLSLLNASGCLTRSGALRAQLSTSALSGSTGPGLRFVRSLVFIDRGVRHKHRRAFNRHGRRVTVVTVTYSANRTVTRLPATISLHLAGLASGTHALRVRYVFHQTVRSHGKRVTKTVTKTQSANFRVC